MLSASGGEAHRCVHPLTSRVLVFANRKQVQVHGAGLQSDGTSITEVCVALTAPEGQKRFLPVALKPLVCGGKCGQHLTFP